MTALNILIHPKLHDILPGGVLVCTPLIADVFRGPAGVITLPSTMYPSSTNYPWILLTVRDDRTAGLPVVGPTLVFVDEETPAGILFALRKHLILSDGEHQTLSHTTPRISGNALFAARCAHGTARQWAQRIGDPELPNFDQLDVSTYGSILRGVHQLIENPDITPEMSHETWLQGKLAEGWVYGPVKDFDKKTHPCCVPYDQLSSADRAKDILFRNIVLTALSVYDMGMTAGVTD